ncbi:hypothetical protein DFQ26_006473 [Actinomortierella ambigua]|nr:hypothetical protein DFQ26_006473 [Actinomortierella ambigua]
MAADCTVPFQEQGDNSIIADLVRKGEREDIPEETPTDYKSWIERCWEQDPSKRPEAAEMLNEDMDDVGYASGSQASMVSITTGMSNLSTSTGGSVTFTARPGIPAKLTVRLSTLEGEYAERAKEMLNIFEGTSYVVPSPIVEELELMVTPVDQLLSDAQHGVAEAQYKLGRKYIQALGVEPDFEEGMRLLEQAADDGHAEALFRRAMMTISWTYTFEAQKDMAVDWLQRASDDGHVSSNTMLHVVRLNRDKDDEVVKADVVKVLEAREFGGDGVASMFLGLLYSDTKEGDKVTHYLERAAMRGQVEGACILGDFYGEGQGVTEDLARARKLYSHASSRWYPGGHFSLAKMFRDGRGVSRDVHKAAMLFRRSTAQGDSDSKAALLAMKL